MGLSTIVRPLARPPARHVVGVNYLQTCTKGQVFDDLAISPAGGFCDAVGVACQPARVV